MGVRTRCTLPLDPPLDRKLGKRTTWEGIQLFRERLLEKVHATIPKGIVGGFVCPVLQRNLKEWHERPRTYVGEC